MRALRVTGDQVERGRGRDIPPSCMAADQRAPCSVSTMAGAPPKRSVAMPMASEWSVIAIQSSGRPSRAGRPAEVAISSAGEAVRLVEAEPVADKALVGGHGRVQVRVAPEDLAGEIPLHVWRIGPTLLEPLEALGRRLDLSERRGRPERGHGSARLECILHVRDASSGGLTPPREGEMIRPRDSGRSPPWSHDRLCPPLRPPRWTGSRRACAGRGWRGS